MLALFPTSCFPPWQNPCKTKKPWALVGGGIAGALVFHFVTCSFAWWSNPAYAKTFNGLIQPIRRSTGLSSSLPFPQEHRCQLHSFSSIIGWVALRMQEPDQSTAPSKAAGANDSRLAGLPSKSVGDDLEQANACGNRDVEAVHLPGHRNMHEQITLVRRQSPDPRASLPPPIPLGLSDRPRKPIRSLDHWFRPT